MIDLVKEVRSGEGLGFDLNFECIKVSKKVNEKLERLRVSGLNVVGNMIGLGEKKLSEFRLSDDDFSVIDRDRGYLMVLRFVDSDLVISNVLELNRVIEY